MAQIGYQTSIEDYESVASNYTIVELIEGDIIVTPPPSILHQRFVQEIYLNIRTLLGDLGEAFVSPIGIKTEANEVFEPDVIFISNEDKSIIGGNYITGAPALVVEVTSPSTKHRDWSIKRDKYWELGVREYWIVDPEKYNITIFTRGNKKFKEAGVINLKDEQIKSKIFPGLRFKLDKFKEG